MTPATGSQIGDTLIGRGQSGRSLRKSRKPVIAAMCAKTYPMLLRYRIARLLETKRTRQTFTTRSTVIARAGTWNRFRTPSSLIVMSALAIPYSARPASAVDEFIESTRLASRNTRTTPLNPDPTSLSSRPVKNWPSAPCLLMKSTPLAPVTPSGRMT